MKEEIIHKEIDLIQNCISRMANNSFMVKGWAVTITVASFAFLSFKREIVIPLCIFIFGIIIALWYLDAFFLHTEKKFRLLYQDVLKKRAMDDCSNLYEIDISIYKDKTNSIFRTMLNKTLIPFYAVLMLFSIVFFIIEINDSKEVNIPAVYEVSFSELSSKYKEVEKNILDAESDIEMIFIETRNIQQEINDSHIYFEDFENQIVSLQENVSSLSSQIENLENKMLQFSADSKANTEKTELKKEL